MINDYLEILIVEKHTLIAFGLLSMVKRYIPNSIVKIVTSLHDAEEAARQKSYDVFIFYIEPVDEAVFNLIKSVRKTNREVLILLGASCQSERMTEYMCRNQINALLTKDHSINEFEIALQSVFQHKSYCSDVFSLLKMKLLSRKKSKMHKDDFPTKREIEVLEHIALGEKSLQIAANLQIKVNTVETHRKNLMQKLNAKNGIDLVMKALHEGWIEVK